MEKSTVQFDQASLWPLKAQWPIRRADKRGQGHAGIQGSLLAIFGMLRALCHQLSQALRVGSAQQLQVQD